MLKIVTIFCLAVACRPAPISPDDKVGTSDQASSNSCPTGSPVSAQCPVAENDPANDGTNALVDPADPANTADPAAAIPAAPADPVADNTGKPCLDMSNKEYDSEYLKLKMTVEWRDNGGTDKGCQVNLEFTANKDMTHKTITKTAPLGLGGQTREQTAYCSKGSESDKSNPNCLYKLVVSFPKESVTASFLPKRLYRDKPERTKSNFLNGSSWYYFEKDDDQPIYTIKYLNINKDNEIKLHYSLTMTSSFDLNITVNDEQFPGTPPRVNVGN